MGGACLVTSLNRNPYHTIRVLFCVVLIHAVKRARPREGLDRSASTPLNKYPTLARPPFLVTFAVKLRNHLLCSTWRSDFSTLSPGPSSSRHVRFDPALLSAHITFRSKYNVVALLARTPLRWFTNGF
jgi:hypothetical protein